MPIDINSMVEVAPTLHLRYELSYDPFVDSDYLTEYPSVRAALQAAEICWRAQVWRNRQG